jgi:hypothetical protein
MNSVKSLTTLKGTGGGSVNKVLTHVYRTLAVSYSCLNTNNPLRLGPANTHCLNIAYNVTSE